MERDPRIGVGLSVLFLRMARMGLSARDFAGLAFRPDLAQAHLQLRRAGRAAPPQRLPEDFATTLRRRRAEVSAGELVYGDTPVWAARGLLRWAGLGRGDRLLDVGAGRGQVLLAARWLGADAVGVELEAHHVDVAAPILAACGADLRQGDGAEADLAGVAVVFCAWTTWSAAARGRLVAHLTGLAPGARVLTLGGPLEAAGFEAVGTRAVLVPWGIEQASLHERVGAPG